MTEKSIKTIPFDGTREGYQTWEFKMRTFLRELGCSAALYRKDMKADVTNDDAIKMNHQAYARIAMAMDMKDTVSIQLVKRSMTKAFPTGDAALAWKTLAERYEPKNAVDKQTLFEQLQGMKLEDVSKDPEVWIMELQRIQSKLSEMGEKVSDGLLMCHILGNLPPAYDNVADNLASDASKTILSVMIALKDKFERIKKSGKSDPKGETVLIGSKRFAGNCRYCGKKGHKAADCFKKKQEDGNQTEL